MSTEPERGRELVGLGGVESLLRRARVIAVVGIHDQPRRPAFYVPEYLFRAGYRIIGVNPRKVGSTLFGEPVRATLAELGESIDVVDVFRRSVDVPDHLDDFLAMSPRPGAVWLQLGIRNDAVRDQLLPRGIDVVQNRCTLADHRALGIGAIEPTG